MIQIFILGSSSAYGVGGTQGWADLLKQHFHAKMYGQGGVGEKYEIYNFAKSGATIDFVQQTFPDQLKQYGRGGTIVTVVAVGGNNSKAEGKPDNFVSTPEKFAKEITNLFTLLKENSSQVIAHNNSFVDESKTNPKLNPLTGGQSYFTNARRLKFRDIFIQLCKQHDIAFADVAVNADEWLQHYLYEDGLHPNQAGHQLIFEAIQKHLTA